MVDRKYTGIRCRTLRPVNTVHGLLQRDTQGTIRYEVENLDRRLVFVQWDTGLEIPVFPTEIEVLAHQSAQL